MMDKQEAYRKLLDQLVRDNGGLLQAVGVSEFRRCHWLEEPDNFHDEAIQC